jgi:dTDP-4-dehydrorhamnose reductase
MSRILVIGAGGMLGHDMMAVLAGHDAHGVTRAGLDICDAEQVMAVTESFDTIINTAAYTQVDQAETDKDAAFAVNADGARNIALAARAHGARLIHLSTDYVFDGSATTPYPEDAPTNPLSVYGASKLAGEIAVQESHPEGSLIVRTSWLYGLHGQSFPQTILRAGLARDTLDVVTDQVGQPTWSRDVAVMIRSLIDAQVPSGVFHATNSGQASWFDFAREIFHSASWDPDRIRPATTASFPRPAPRPAWSVLGHQNWSANNLEEPRSWREAFLEAWDTELSSLLSETP